MKLFLAFVLLVLPVSGQRRLAAAVPTPAHVLGYELGDRFTSHAGIEKYIMAVRDAAPNRVRVLPYGTTYEGRTLYLVVISSPDNINNLETIRKDIHTLADPRSASARDVDAIIASSPAIAWLSYGVHGNEASSPEAALNVIHQLASRTDEEVESLLKNLVIVIDPLLNPDGHERYVNYQITRSGVKPVDDRYAAEHNEDWPSGRTNHYFFDLNRDWAWLTQQESRARVKVYRDWMPQVHVDYHEMGYNSSYFFFPAFQPINTNLPASTMAWGKIYGQANAAAFDAKGWSYWSGERFDLFYPGYGDSWPSLNGAIGMTYEQAGQMGVRVKRSDETTLTLKDRLEHHSATSFATLKATAAHREARLRDFTSFFTQSMDEGRTGPVKAYLIDPGKDPARAATLVSVLQQQGVEVRQATQSFSLDGLKTYFSTSTISRKFPAGSYVIPLYQPLKRLIVALMEQEPKLSDTVFYDISSWALPLAYGVDAYWTGAALSVSTQPITEVSLPPGRIEGDKASYAYLLDASSNDAMKALAYLLQHDVKVNVAMKEFSAAGHRYDRGAIIIPVAGNDGEIHKIVQSAAESFHLTFAATNSGFTESGINLGSDRAVRLKKPKIIVATGPSVGTSAYGAIWSMFDQHYGIDFVPMKLAQIRSADLHDYTTMILPDDNGSGSGYRSQLDSNTVQKIKTWIAGGGTLIAIEGGAAFASNSKIAGVKVKEKSDKKDEKKDEKKDDKKDGKKKEEVLSDEEMEKRMTVEEKERKSRLEEIPGTIMRVRLDTSHPLGFGYDNDINVFKSNQTMFELSEKGYNVGIYTKSPRRSGYMSKKNEQLLEETPFLVHEQVGAGNVILFADDPNFRLFWNGLNRIFLNSVLVMPSVRNVRLTSDHQ